MLDVLDALAPALRAGMPPVAALRLVTRSGARSGARSGGEVRREVRRIVRVGVGNVVAVRVGCAG